MPRLPKEYWKIGFINKEQECEWDTAYAKLDAGYRWQVDSALHFMIHYKQPWEHYTTERCDDCIEGLYLIDVSHSGIGNKVVHIMIYFNKESNILTPVDCEDI